MKTKAVLELEDVKTMAAAAERWALERGWPVTIAVVDDGGHLLWLQRLDGAPAFTADMARAKARTAALVRCESKLLEDVILQGRPSFMTAPGAEGLLEGGVPILHEGCCLGAVGVSGVESHQDAEVAWAGVRALVV